MIGGRRISRRRGLLLAGTGAAGLVVGAGATEAGNLAAGPNHVLQPASEVPPSEDLMYEHGVLKRVLLVYREAAHRVGTGHHVPLDALHEAAQVVHSFIEGFHEGLEEAYVFPRLKAAGQHVEGVNTLLVQHARGRRITQRVLATTRSQPAGPTARPRLARDLRSFSRMYEPHEAREDTVIFPTFRRLTPAKTFAHLGEHFAELQDEQFGPHGFADVVDRVAGIERSFGLDDLSQYTPRG
jgi:hemerythrin-like domain-containing protein